MLKRLTLALAAASLVVVSCTPPPPVPPPKFRPNPPYPPDVAGPYGETQEPGGYGQPDGYPQESPTHPAPPSDTRPGDYPTATRTGNPGEVVSPYPPYKVIDVSEFRSGQLARDPWNQDKIFRVP